MTGSDGEDSAQTSATALARQPQATASPTPGGAVLSGFAQKLAGTEEIALGLREHQASVHDWQHSTRATELHRWVKIFDGEFKLALPSYPVIRFAKIRNAYATYDASRSEVGTKDNTFNVHELNRDPALLLRTLCHELIHLWQHYWGSSPQSNYHNKQFRDKALGCGLIVDRRGCTNGHTQTFTELLAKYGVRLLGDTPLAPPEPRVYGAQTHPQKMKKWRCGCTNVRCTVELQAECLGCGRRFQLA